MKLKFLILFVLPFLFNCKSENKNKLSAVQNDILEKCIKNVIKLDSNLKDSDYLVNPFFGSFAFNNYTANHYEVNDKTYKNKNKVLRQIELTDEEFSSLQTEINNKFLNKFFYDLENLSKGSKSKKVFTFSGISEKLVFLEIITFLDEIKKGDLINEPINFDNKKIKEVVSLIIVLDDNEIKEIVVDNGIVFEKW